MIGRNRAPVAHIHSCIGPWIGAGLRAQVGGDTGEYVLRERIGFLQVDVLLPGSSPLVGMFAMNPSEVFVQVGNLLRELVAGCSGAVKVRSALNLDRWSRRRQRAWEMAVAAQRP